MFDSLVESGSHKDDLARKGSFFLGTFVIYGLVLLAVAVGSVIWYNDSIPDPSLELLTLVAPVPMQQQEEPKPQNEPKPAAKQEPTVAMRQEISVVAPVVASNQVAKETTREVARAKSIGVVIGARDVGSSNDITANAPVGVVGGGGGGGGGPVAPVVTDTGPPPPPAPKPSPPKRTAPVSGGVLNGKVVSRVTPAYPPIAKAARAAGTVVVQITVDESGRVVAANAVSGHPLLQQAAVNAVRGWKFSPTLLSGQPVKVTGSVTVNFTLQ